MWRGLNRSDFGRVKSRGPRRAPIAKPTLSPVTAATMSSALIHQMLSPPAAATTPAVIRSESPGRKKPMRRPVSVKTIPNRRT